MDVQTEKGKMRILFEDNLNNEAGIIQKIVKNVFNIDCEIKKGNFSKLLKFKKSLEGYEIQIAKRFRDDIILTSKDLFPYGSNSKEDDWVFGFASKQKQFFISVARLKTNSDNPSKKLEISKKKYQKRIEFIILHELGHRLIKKQKHYKEFILTNPKTEYRSSFGMHCPDNKCIMSEFIDIRDMDKHIKMNYKSLFCRRCLK